MSRLWLHRLAPILCAVLPLVAPRAVSAAGLAPTGDSYATSGVEIVAKALTARFDIRSGAVRLPATPFLPAVRPQLQSQLTVSEPCSHAPAANGPAAPHARLHHSRAPPARS